MKHLSASQILGVALPHRDIPHGSGHVRIQALTGKRRVELLEAYTANVEAAKADPAVALMDQVILQLIFSIVDPKSGEPLFTVADHDALRDNVAYDVLKAWFEAFTALSSPQDDLKKS